MIFTRQEVEQDWLLGKSLAVDTGEVVRLFNLVVDRFGREWVEASRIQNGQVVRGAPPTLRVVMLGQLLASLGSAPNSSNLLDKVRERRDDAKAELLAMYLVRLGASSAELMVEPEIVVSGRNRKPDFSVRQPGDELTYVEVTMASTSMAQADVLSAMKRIAGLAQDCDGSFALEVFLKREPTSAEVGAIAAEIIDRYRQAAEEQTELPNGLGTLYWNTEQPGAMTLADHGEAYTPRIGMSLASIFPDCEYVIFEHG